MILAEKLRAAGLATQSAGGGVTSISYQTSTSASNHNGSITMPSGISSGDVIIVCQSATKSTINQSPPTAAYGTGFTSIGTDSVSRSDGQGDYTNMRMCLSAKIADGTEASSSIGGFMNDSKESAAVYVYRPNVAATTITAVGYVSDTSNANPAAQTITASGTSKAHIVVAHYNSRNTSPTITYSGATSDQNFDDIGNADCRLAARATGVSSGGGSNVTIDINDNNSLNGVAGCYIEVE